jgi:hypothetical protein
MNKKRAREESVIKEEIFGDTFLLLHPTPVRSGPSYYRE